MRRSLRRSRRANRIYDSEQRELSTGNADRQFMRQMSCVRSAYVLFTAVRARICQVWKARGAQSIWTECCDAILFEIVYGGVRR